MNNLDNQLSLGDDVLERKIKGILKSIWVSENVNQILKTVPWNELSMFLVDLFNKRVSWVDGPKIMEQMTQTRFCRSSQNNIRKIHIIEAEIAKTLPDDVILLDVSPLDPFWLNNFLNWTSQKKIISTNRWYDLISDWSTKLVLDWAVRRKELIRKQQNSKERVCLWTNFRCFRVQSFKWMHEKDVYAHFKVFASSVQWRDIERRDFEYFAIGKVLRSYFELFRTLNQQWISKINWLDIFLSDMRITEMLFRKAKCLNDDVRLKGAMAEFRDEQIKRDERWEEEIGLFDYLQIGKNPIIDTSKWIDKSAWEEYSITDYLIFLEKIAEHLKPLSIEFEDLGINFLIDLNRSAWIWHYSHLAMKWFIRWNDKMKFWLFDWWSVNWSAKLLGDKKEKCFVAWLWTWYMANFI